MDREQSSRHEPRPDDTSGQDRRDEPKTGNGARHPPGASPIQLNLIWPSGEFGDPDVDVIGLCLDFPGDLSPKSITAIFNRRYAVISEGKTWVVWFERSWDNGGYPRLRYAEFKHFLQRHANHTLSVRVPEKPRPVTKSYGDWWFHHPDRRQYLSGTMFDPTGAQHPGVLNLWRGWGVEPRQGDWTLMQNHIEQVLCAGNTRHYNYVLQWLARMVQHPELPAEVALVLRGSKGAGKGAFAKWLLKLVGQHAGHISNAEHLVGKFNAHLRGCILLFADEAFFAGDKKHERVLKQLITERYFMSEAKFQDATMAANMLHIIMASNDDWVVPASHDERRYFILDVTDAHRGDLAYFDALDAELEAGGAEAMLHDLLAMDLIQFQHRQMPASPGLDDQKLRSLPSMAAWLQEILARGYVWQSAYGLPIFREWQDTAATELLLGSYQQWCRKNHRRMYENRVEFGKFLAQYFTRTRFKTGAIPLLGEVERPSDGLDLVIYGRDRPWGYRLGSLKAARQRFLHHHRITAKSLNWG